MNYSSYHHSRRRNWIACIQLQGETKLKDINTGPRKDPFSGSAIPVKSLRKPSRNIACSATSATKTDIDDGQQSKNSNLVAEDFPNNDDNYNAGKHEKAKQTFENRSKKRTSHWIRRVHGYRSWKP